MDDDDDDDDDDDEDDDDDDDDATNYASEMCWDLKKTWPTDHTTEKTGDK